MTFQMVETKDAKLISYSDLPLVHNRIASYSRSQDHKYIAQLRARLPLYHLVTTLLLYHTTKDPNKRDRPNLHNPGKYTQQGVELIATKVNTIKSRGW